MIVSSAIPNILWEIFETEDKPELVTPKMVLMAGALTTLTALLLYSFFIDRVVLKRMTKLNAATKEITKGNYEVFVEPDQRDEITEVIKSFNKMANELQSNEYLNKEFVRNFSHELKTPLSAIKGYADLINQMDLTKEEMIEYSSIISQEANRLSTLSKSMLSISLVDSQNIISRNDEYNIAEQVRNVIQLTQIEWEKKNIQLDLDLEDLIVTSNKELTYQIWTNLFSNAVKFSNDSDPVSIKLESLEDSIKFSITNNGVIDKDDQTKIFDLFFVSEKSRTSKSNGVGLTLIKKIITKLNGDIEFVSENGITTFIVFLPKN